MKTIKMEIIKSSINEELHELSQADKNNLSNSIYHLMYDVEIDDTWKERISNQGKSIERFVFDCIHS